MVSSETAESNLVVVNLFDFWTASSLMTRSCEVEHWDGENAFVNHDVLIFIFYLYWGNYCAHKIDKIWKLVATKRKIYDDAKSGRYDSAKSASSYTRSHYQPSRDYTSRDYGARSAGSRYSRDDYTTGSRYSDYTSSKSHGRGSMFRGLFEKTFSRFFGGRLRKQTLSFFIWHLCLCFVWELFELTASFVDAAFAGSEFGVKLTTLWFSPCESTQPWHWSRTLGCLDAEESVGGLNWWQMFVASIRRKILFVTEDGNVCNLGFEIWKQNFYKWECRQNKLSTKQRICLQSLQNILIIIWKRLFVDIPEQKLCKNSWT